MALPIQHSLLCSGTAHVVAQELGGSAVVTRPRGGKSAIGAESGEVAVS